MTVAVGTNSCSSSSRFGLAPRSSWHARDVAARPVQAGDKPDRDRVAAGREDDGNRRGCRLGRQCRSGTAARRSRPPDGEPDRPPAPAVDRIGPRPSGIRSLRSGPRHSQLLSGPGGMRAQRGAYRSASALLRNPITGIAGCCARAASGHAAAAPPSSVMNSRRFIRSPRRRGRAASAERQGRAPWPFAG